MTRRVYLLANTSGLSLRVEQVRAGYPGAEVWVREEELTPFLRSFSALADQIDEQVRVTRDYAKGSGMDHHQIELMAICTSHFLTYAQVLREAVTALAALPPPPGGDDEGEGVG